MRGWRWTVKTWSEVWPAASGTGGALPLPKSRPQPILLPPILLPKTLVLGSLSRQAPLALVPSLCRPFTSLPCGHPCPKCPSPSLPCPQDPSSLYSVPPTFSQSCLTSLFVSPGHTHLKKQDITSGLKSYPAHRRPSPHNAWGPWTPRGRSALTVPCGLHLTYHCQPPGLMLKPTYPSSTLRPHAGGGWERKLQCLHL
jgi:hypothetical protein